MKFQQVKQINLKVTIAYTMYIVVTLFSSSFPYLSLLTWASIRQALESQIIKSDMGFFWYYIQLSLFV